MMATHGRDDVFALPLDEGRYYLYAPLRRMVAIVNRPTVNAVARWLDHGVEGLSGADAEAVNSLIRRGLLGEPFPSPPTFPDDYRFCPHEVTLFITSRCNLRCRYCYANAGSRAAEMPWNIARSAVDLVAANAAHVGNPSFAVGFHGGGEPTVAWDMLTRATTYAQAKAEELGLAVEIFAATNGLLSPAQREYVIKNFKSLTVSLDGPREIQDYYRPRANGHGSYDEIHETLKSFNEAGFFYSVRSTITSGSVERMVDIVEHMHGEFQVADLHMEPAWACGRCLTTGEKPPSDESFVENFQCAVKRGQELGVHVHYSGARLDVLTSKFCAAPGDGFTVLPEGLVTSCFEITEPTDRRASIFYYGHYDHATDRFVFDDERIKALLRLSVENISYCGDCFCKWHCAGDCLAKVFARSASDEHRGSARCQLNRTLTLHHLNDLVRAATNGGSREKGDSDDAG